MFVYAILILLPALALSADPLEGILQNLLDANKDGKITIAETEAYFLSYDTNGDGEISSQEFITAVDKIDPALVGHENTLFTLFDRNNDKHVNKADIDAVFHLADLNKNNVIEKSELHLVVALAGTHVG